VLVERIKEFVKLVERWSLVKGEALAAFGAVDVEKETAAAGGDHQADSKKPAEKEDGLVDAQRAAEDGPVEKVKHGPGTGGKERHSKIILELGMERLKTIPERQPADIVDGDADADAAVVHLANVLINAGDSGAL